MSREVVPRLDSVPFPLATSRHRSGTAPFLLAMLVLGGYLTTTFVLTHMSLGGTVLRHYDSPHLLGINLYGWERIGLDKVYHFCAYAGLTGLLLLAQSLRCRVTERPFTLSRRLLLCAVVFAYGIVDECTQPWVGRNMEGLDMLANLAGIFSCWLCAEIAVRVCNVRRSPRHLRPASAS